MADSIPKKIIDFTREFSKIVDSKYPDGEMNQRDFDALLSKYFPHSVKKIVLQFLDDNKLIILSTSYDGISFHLGINGASIVHASIFEDTLSQSSDSSTSVGVWEPLNLDRESSAAKDAIEALEELTERIRGENGFAATEPDKHAALTWSLNTGLEMLRNRAPSREQVMSLVVGPIRWVMEKFVGSAIAELGKRALETVQRWLQWTA